jgi:hypothetical protein
MRALTVVIRPARKPAALRMAAIRLAVVVLPSVPVTLITHMRRAGKACHAAASQPKAARGLTCTGAPAGTSLAARSRSPRGAARERPRRSGGRRA